MSRTADGATTTFAYDNPAGRWIAASNAQSVDTIFQDERGRVAREVAVFGTQKYEVVSKYLDAGPRDTVQIIGPSWTRVVAYHVHVSSAIAGVLCVSPAAGRVPVAVYDAPQGRRTRDPRGRTRK